MSPVQGHSWLSLARMLLLAPCRDPHGAGGGSAPGRKSPVERLALPSQPGLPAGAQPSHSAGHVPVPRVTWPKRGQSRPEPRQCIFPPSDARGTAPGRGHNPGAPLTLAHIWPRRTSGERSAPSPSCPVSPPPAPREGGTDGFAVPRLDGGPRPYLTPRHRAGRREPGGPVPARPWLPSRRRVGRRLRAWRHRGSIYEAFPPRAGRQQQSAPGTRGRRLCRGWIGVKREAGRSPPQRAGRTLPLAAPARET